METQVRHAWEKKDGREGEYLVRASIPPQKEVAKIEGLSAFPKVGGTGGNWKKERGDQCQRTNVSQRPAMEKLSTMREVKIFTRS